MCQSFLAKIDLLYQQFKAHDATQVDRIHRYRNIEPESAKLLNLLIRTKQAKDILEIGTSTGYSTLWLADAAQATCGKVTSLEIEAVRTKLAQKNACEFSLDGFIDFLVADAQDYLSQSKAKFDFILLDAERDAYCDYWQYLQHLIKEKGGLLVVDNVLSHELEVKEFINLVNENSNFITTTLNIGAGLFLVTRK